MVLLVVWAISVGYMSVHIKTKWVPLDEGTLGLSAERALRGQMPHRDFDDYTGGLTYLYALAFRVLGISSGSMRVVLFVFFVAWIPVVFYIASRFGSAIAAGGVTLVAVAWSIVVYPGPLPSWYNLFFATFGSAALLRYLETNARRWIFLAGLCAGASALAKITAAYFVAAALLFFLFREQSVSNEQNRNSSARAPFYKLTVTLAMAIFLLLLFRMIHVVPGISEFVFFVFPAIVLVALIVARELSGVAGPDRERFASLMRMCAPFLMGAVIPVLLFLIPYIKAGAVYDLVNGLIAGPARIIRFTFYAPRSPLSMVAAIPFIVTLMIGAECGKTGRIICGCIIAIYGSVILLLAGRSTLVFYVGWCSLGSAIPLLVLAGVLIVWFLGRHGTLDDLRQQQIMLLLCVAALCGIVQFPFSAPIYFFYVAPLVILGAMAVLASIGRPPKFVLGALVGFFLFFVVLPATDYEMRLPHTRGEGLEELEMPRAGGLRVDPQDAQVYNELIATIQMHAKGQIIYAAPDCPEVYFLSGFQSPSRHYFEYAEVHPDHTVWVLQEIEKLYVNVVAINDDPRFSAPISPDLRSALEERFPNFRNLRGFQVRWKE